MPIKYNKLKKKKNKIKRSLQNESINFMFKLTTESRTAN